MSADVRHSSRVTQAGFTMIPNSVVLRRDLSPAAKLVYGYLKHLAWRNGDDSAAEADPPRSVVAADLNMTEKAVTVCVRELQKAPTLEGADDQHAKLLVAVRRGQGRTNAYVLNDPEDPDDVPDSGRSRKSKSAFLEKPDGPFPHARASKGGRPKTSVQDKNSPHTPPLDQPPKATNVDGRNLPVDALTEACGIDPESPRLVQAATALNGRGTQKGIRRLYWAECQRHAATAGAEDALAGLHADPAMFERKLADRVRRKAALIRERQPWRQTLTPAAVRDLWLDIETMPVEKTRGAVVMDADRLARLAAE